MESVTALLPRLLIYIYSHFDGCARLAWAKADAVKLFWIEDISTAFNKVTEQQTANKG
jgi:hypothetical protein